MRIVLTLFLFSLTQPIIRAEEKIESVPDFSLPLPDRSTWSLHQQKQRITVIAYISCECPMSNAYLKTLIEMHEKYQSKRVQFIAINANPDETPEMIAQHRKEFDVTFPILIDPKGISVKALNVTVNPEVFVIDDEFRLQYRGRIDDGYLARLKPNPKPSQHDLRDAIEAILNGKPIKTRRTVAFGCPLPQQKEPATSASASVTDHKDVLPILQERCQGCHRPGNVAPFSLLTYRQAVKWSEAIVEETRNRTMPPWKAAKNHFLDDSRAMNESEIQTLASWVEQGRAEGNPKDAPKPKNFPDGWSLGQPDLILEPEADVVIDATGRDVFHCLVFPTNFAEDRLIAAIEVQPGNPRVVHHTIQVIDTEGRARKLRDSYQAKMTEKTRDRGPGYSVSMGMGFFPHPANGLGGWAPGLVPKRLPDGLGFKLPKGSDIVMQVHYHRTGKVEKDRTRIGLYFSKGKPKAEFQSMAVPGLFFRIPPNEKSFRIDQKYVLTENVKVHWLVPHMHLLGQDIELLAQKPNETEESLIKIPKWDYNWQEMYPLKQPAELPKGTTLHIRATFDNSKHNPLNPNSPPRAVRIGEQTTDEMCFVFMGVECETRSWRKLSIAP